MTKDEFETAYIAFLKNALALIAEARKESTLHLIYCKALFRYWLFLRTADLHLNRLRYAPAYVQKQPLFILRGQGYKETP